MDGIGFGVVVVVVGDGDGDGGENCCDDDIVVCTEEICECLGLGGQLALLVVHRQERMGVEIGCWLSEESGKKNLKKSQSVRWKSGRETNC